MLLMYGNANILDIDSSFDYHCIFNLASYKAGFNILNIIPPNELGRSDSNDFDIAYFNYIMYNDGVFVDFFRVIYYLYMGKDVYIMACEEDWAENLLESVLKMIQQRYGINAIRITDDYDYMDAKLNYDMKFADYGRMNLDADRDRFIYLIEKYKSITGCLPFDLEGYIVNE